MVKAFYFLALPGAFDVCCVKQIGFVDIVCYKADVKSAGVIAQAGSPHALSVDPFVVCQPGSFCIFQDIIQIVDEFPVHQVIGTQNSATWKIMHGGAEHIIGIITPDHIGIRVVTFHNWILHNNSFSLN